jgi:hypothetical protein
LELAKQEIKDTFADQDLLASMKEGKSFWWIAFS